MTYVPHDHPASHGSARRVRDLLRSRLLDEEFLGQRLPDEAQFMGEYRVGRNVVRAALAELQREGLIDRRQGAGTFQTLFKSRHRLAGANGIAASIDSPFTRMVTRVIGIEEISTPADLVAEIAVPAGSPCLVVDSVTSIDGRPAIVLTSYLGEGPARRRLAEVASAGVWAGDWYDALARADLAPCRREVLIEAVAIDRLVAPFLEVDVGDPAFRFERRLRLGDGEIAEYGFSYCRGDLVTFAATDVLEDQPSDKAGDRIGALVWDAKPEQIDPLESLNEASA